MSTYKQVTIPVFPLTPYPPASSYKLFSYTAGTTTKQATFTDSTGNTQNANPLTIQFGSSAPTYVTVFCQVGVTMKFVLAPSTDTDPPTSPLWTVDNIAIDDNLDLSPYITISSNTMHLKNTQLDDPNSATALTVGTGSGTPINYLQVTPAPTASNPSLSAVGGSTNVGLDVNLKGTGQQTLKYADTRTNTVAVPSIIQATTSGTPANSIGVGQLFKAQSADENPSDFGQIDFLADDVTAASEDTRFRILLRRAGAALASAFEFVLTSAFKYIFTGAPTADRTITLPDADINLRACAFSVYRSSSQSIPNNTNTAVQFNTKNFDPSGSYDNSTNFRYTAPITGYYFFTAAVAQTAQSTTLVVEVALRVNGATFVASSAQVTAGGVTANLTGTAEPIVKIAAVVSLAATDYIEVIYRHNDAGAQNIGGTANGTYFHGFKLSSQS